MTNTVQIKTYIEARLAHWNKQLTMLQDNCQHPLKLRMSHGNTRAVGDVTYWVKYKCPECGKEWKEESINQASNLTAITHK